jgi:hypothetical protein
VPKDFLSFIAERGKEEVQEPAWQRIYIAPHRDKLASMLSWDRIYMGLLMKMSTKEIKRNQHTHSGVEQGVISI